MTGDMEFTETGGRFVFERTYRTPSAPLFEKGDRPFFPTHVEVRWYDYLYSATKRYSGHTVKLKGPIRLTSGKPGVRESEFSYGHDNIAHVFHSLPDWLRPIYAKAREAYVQQRSSLWIAVGCAAGIRINGAGSHNYPLIGARKVVEAILLSMYGPHDAALKAEELIDDAVKKMQAGGEV